VERQVLLINELAGGHASLDLQAGEQPGSTDIVLTQQPEPLISGRLDANNEGSPSTGSNRIGLSLNANSPFNLGERISANVLLTNTGNLTSYNLRGELPVGGDGWRLSAAASRATYSLGGDFASLDASGSADSLRLGAAYPLIRSRASNLKLQIEADKSKLVDHYGASNTDLDKQSHGLTATLSGDWLDDWLGGGSSRIDLALRSAQLDLGATAATFDAPPAGPDTAGSFNKVNVNAQRQQNVTKDLSLQFNLTWQFANKNLDSSEKLGLGGPTTLPGYANGEASGDSGTLVKLALRWQALPELALTAFADYGKLQLAHDPLPTVTNNDKRMSDVGLSADWLISKDFSVNAILAWAGNEAPNPADNARPRFWINLGYGW
jgi:hemolysin activation/secretion protein